MISITYLSRAEHHFSDAELMSMLESFRANNGRNGVSGVLLYNGAGTFIQVLEGESSDVEPLYERIKQDTRHSKVVCLRKAIVQSRRFADWRMGFRNLTRDVVDDTSKMTLFLSDDKLEHFVSEDADFALKVLTSFRDKTRELIF
ncbi:blue light sensor protein [Marinomonas mediterranea]|jgi:Sensors of blue-light using FAD.|uniref:BLUF domain protein n=1 Tax=Marinomonas mediterranea (strain ATCC 700492 / JCM 21426 / NBRC 103028 / MMB-1) TaxID=717774 RepID=F2JWR3_MARM1|nr:BLUF domain-containing protein [Marinomonas mediterranea]ADZ91827.1 BLUF domain protein [Marinomonas mediterranea MMB-1]WCN13863.1 blue light sensor protein [Marinomonas mediterranea]WCN17919.1 blue light sensor protein [Marinomonas mediterranea MMB-1]